MYLSSVLVVEVNSLFAELTDVSATLKYGSDIEFVNLNPGLSRMSSFHMQKHDRCKSSCNYPLGVTPVTTTAMAAQNSTENPVHVYKMGIGVFDTQILLLFVII